MAKRKKKDAACELVAYRFYGVPSEQDAVQEDKTFGCCRYLWNRMLGDHNTLYAEIGHVPNNTPADYKDLDECLFLNEVDSLALANTALNLDAAFERFFKKTGGYPRFKAKKRAKRSYTTNAVYGSYKGRPTCNIHLNTSNGLLKLPKHQDPVRLKLHRPVKPGGKLKSVIITQEPDGKRYYSILMEYPKPQAATQPVMLWSSFFVTLVAKKIVLINLCCRPCFIWGSITIITVWTNMIIINVCKFFYLLIECFLCCKLIQICAFILQGIEVTLHRCIVVRISCFAHALCHIYRFAEFGKCFGRIL